MHFLAAPSHGCDNTEIGFNKKKKLSEKSNFFCRRGVDPPPYLIGDMFPKKLIFLTPSFSTLGNSSLHSVFIIFISNIFTVFVNI